MLWPVLSGAVEAKGCAGKEGCVMGQVWREDRCSLGPGRYAALIYPAEGMVGEDYRCVLEWLSVIQNKLSVEYSRVNSTVNPESPDGTSTGSDGK